MPATRSRIRTRMPRQCPRSARAARRVPTRRASALARRTTRIFPWRRACCRRPMRPHVAAVYAFARVADDIADEGDGDRRTSGRRGCGTGRQRLHDAAAADRSGRRVSREPRRPGVRRARSLDSIARSAGVALRRSVERVRSGYHDDPLRLVGRRARLLPPIGESGRPARAAHRRLSRRRARSIVGRAVHGAAADQLLAGLRPRLARRPALRAARRACDACGAREADLARRRADAGVGARARRVRRRHARRASTRAARVCDGVARPAAAASCGSPGSAAGASSSASSAERADLLQHRPALGAADVAAARCGAPRRWKGAAA